MKSLQERINDSLHSAVLAHSQESYDRLLGRKNLFNDLELQSPEVRSNILGVIRKDYPELVDQVASFLKEKHDQLEASALKQREMHGDLLIELPLVISGEGSVLYTPIAKEVMAGKGLFAALNHRLHRAYESYDPQASSKLVEKFVVYESRKADGIEQLVSGIEAISEEFKLVNVGFKVVRIPTKDYFEKMEKEAKLLASQRGTGREYWIKLKPSYVKYGLIPVGTETSDVFPPCGVNFTLRTPHGERRVHVTSSKNGQKGRGNYITGKLKSVYKSMGITPNDEILVREIVHKDSPAPVFELIGKK